MSARLCCSWSTDMFGIHVTIPYRSDSEVWPLDVTVQIDQIVLVKSILDKEYTFGVESFPLYDCVPRAELLLEDGRKVPVLETAEDIHRYLDAYRQLENFYTAPAKPAMSLVPSTRGEVIPLFKAPPCDSSEGSTPA